ncbi:DNA repair exonuclease [uncultured Pelagimonas sp.]|uniref:metallophosphoesterase family protein n=1 Tax=uncultured Pelagimonas sp. TaxID=1618102 RepID=UPI00261FF784|nr:DNA repair exonuclease [uncultured Pelagimonas sp.]
MRFIVSADTHLGSPIRSVALRNPELGERLKQASFDTFRRIVDMAILEAADALVLAGDIFDSDFPDLKSRAFLITQLTRAGTAGIPTILIRGNHDALLDHTAHGSLGPDIHLLHKGNPTVEIGNVMFHGLSFDKSHLAKSLLPDYPEPVIGRTNVGLMHTSLGGSPGHDPYAPCSEQDLLAYGYDLWCLGHIHMPFERRSGSTLAVMPGIPQPRHYGERSGGSVAAVTVGDGIPQLERRDVGHLRFMEAKLDLTELGDQSEVLCKIDAALKAAQDPLRITAVRLQVTTARHTDDDLQALATELLESIDDVFLDKVKVLPPKNLTDDKVNDLARLMRAEVQEDGFRQACAEMLDDMRNALPPNIRDALPEDEITELLEEAIDEVSLSLHGVDTQ